MRRAVAVGVSLAMALTLGACGTTQQNKGANTEEQSQQQSTSQNQNEPAPENESTSDNDNSTANTAGNSATDVNSITYHQISSYDELLSINKDDNDANKVSLSGTVTDGPSHIDDTSGQGNGLNNFVLTLDDGNLVLISAYDSVIGSNLPSQGQRVNVCGMYVGPMSIGNDASAPTVLFLKYGDAPAQSTKSSAAVPTEYSNALKKAKQYSDMMHMSKQGLYDQLTSEYGEQFSADAAQYAIDNLEVDYNANALAKAKEYEEQMAMSPSAIYDQLTSDYGEKFTADEAQYAVDHLND